MNKYFDYSLFMLLFFPLVLAAQVEEEKMRTDSDLLTAGVFPTDSLSVRMSLPAPVLPFAMPALGFDGCSLWYVGSSGSSWNLHKGLNAQLGMSVSVAFGKYAPSRAGFGQTANLAYAMPLGKGFSAAAGFYVQNMDWGAFHQTDFGISTVFGYKVNDVVSLYAYGTKSLASPMQRRPLGYFPLFVEQFRNRVGAMAEFKLGENAAIQVSVERCGDNRRGFPLGTLSPSTDALRRTP